MRFSSKKLISWDTSDLKRQLRRRMFSLANMSVKTPPRIPAANELIADKKRYRPVDTKPTPQQHKHTNTHAKGLGNAVPVLFSTPGSDGFTSPCLHGVLPEADAGPNPSNDTRQDGTRCCQDSLPWGARPLCLLLLPLPHRGQTDEEGYAMASPPPPRPRSAAKRREAKMNPWAPAPAITFLWRAAT